MLFVAMYYLLLDQLDLSKQ
uniref:Uncharacterized protein n=1 Tax=Rhizophora mucronata TaxID=61149 RepID=A0A2P2MXL3_RHIMU